MKVELFFDYACPYCYKGHKNLLELRENFPDLEILWRPCEAHPRPEYASVHSDLAIAGMYYVEEHGGDLWRYHALVYAAMFDRHEDISDIGLLSGLAETCGADREGFAEALAGRRYESRVQDGNRYAWEEQGLFAVPSYVCGSRSAKSQNGVMVSARELEEFLSSLRN